MNDLSSILIVIIALAVALAAYLWRKISLVEDQLREQRGSLEDQRKDAEKARASAKSKVKEVEDLRQKLRDTKAKLKRKTKDPNKGATQSAQVTDEFGPKGSAASNVHVGNQEAEARYEAKLSKLGKERDAAKARADKLEALQAKMKAEKAAAKKALDEGGESSASPEAQVVALQKELSVLRREAKSDKHRTEKTKTKADGRERAATRRANANHAQYLVIKGQLELAEDKLAMYRTRYEGAKPPATFKPKADASKIAAANEDKTEAPAKEKVDAPAPAVAEAAVVEAAVVEAAVAIAAHPEAAPETMAEAVAEVVEQKPDDTAAPVVAETASEEPPAEEAGEVGSAAKA